MTIEQLQAVEKRCEREARKWVGYLETVRDRATRESELKRKLMETYLEGAQGVGLGS